MPESIEKYSAQESLEKRKKDEERALELAREIKEIRRKIEEGGETIEDYQQIIKPAEKIKNLYEKRIIGWKKEGQLTEKDVLVQYQAEGWVHAANFSPEGDKVVIGSSDNMMRVISLTEKDEQNRPKVLAKYQAEEWVHAANFSPEGDKVVIGSGDKMMKVIG